MSEADSRAHFARLQRLEDDIGLLMQTKQLREMRVWVRNVTLLCFTVLAVWFVGRPLYWSLNTRYGTQKFHSSPAAIEPAPDQAPLYEGDVSEGLSPVEAVSQILDTQDTQEPISAAAEEGEEGMNPADVVKDTTIDEPSESGAPVEGEGEEGAAEGPVEEETPAASEGEEGMSPVDIVTETLDAGDKSGDDAGDSPVDVVTEMLDKAEADTLEDGAVEPEQGTSWEPTRKLLWRA